MIKNILSKLKQKSYQVEKSYFANETNLVFISQIRSKMMKTKPFTILQDFEFKFFSQFGNDSSVQYLINSLNISNKTFIEFGVTKYEEVTTRFLLLNNN